MIKPNYSIGSWDCPNRDTDWGRQDPDEWKYWKLLILSCQDPLGPPDHDIEEVYQHGAVTLNGQAVLLNGKWLTLTLPLTLIFLVKVKCQVEAITVKKAIQCGMKRLSLSNPLARR